METGPATTSSVWVSQQAETLPDAQMEGDGAHAAAHDGGGTEELEGELAAAESIESTQRHMNGSVKLI